MSISDGRVVESSDGYIGYKSSSAGVVTVDGANSTWANNEHLYVGYEGSGVLNITNGGEVTVEKDTLVANRDDSSGTIHFDNGILTTGGLLCGSDDLTGTGTINTSGIVSDIDLVFDATHGLNQTFNINNNPGQNITVNLNVNGYCSMGAGYRGTGTMSISDGIVLESTMSYIGYEPGSTGEVTVNGVGSGWTNSGNLIVGNGGSGVLSITGGGSVISNDRSYIGYFSSSTGIVTVDGVGSALTNSGNLYVGGSGSGRLNILGGGLVSVAEILNIGNNDFINMATGGMLALYNADDASGLLADFLGLIEGTDAIRYWDYALGDWADIAGGTLGEDYTLSYLTEGDLTGYTVLTVLEVVLLAGDANRDGMVSAGDYASVQANFGNTGIAGIPGDANGDGIVSAGDYASVQANFGNVASASIPEPATLSLLALGGVAMVGRKRK